MVTEALSDRTLTVYEAEKAINFAVEQLKSQDCDFARRMARVVQTRYCN